jgi:plasmid stabilization system protein ParE
MAKEVILTPIAVKDLQNIIDYLNYKWGTSVVGNFVDRFEKVLALLSEDASIFPFVDTVKQIQKCVLTKHNTTLCFLKRPRRKLKYLQYLIPVRRLKNLALFSN